MADALRCAVPALRLRRYFNDHADVEPFKSLRGEAERAAFVAELHKLKTQLFVELVERGELPLRPGVARLVAEARAANVKARRLQPGCELASLAAR